MADGLHNYQRKLERTTRSVHEAGIPEESKQAILGFRDYCFSRGLSVARVEKLMFHLRELAYHFPAGFAAARKPDIQRAVTEIERSDLSEWTKRDFRIALKIFYRWLRRTTKHPPEVAWLSSHVANHRRKLPEELLTEDDVLRLIGACQRPRDRAFVALLYETGCRIGETASLRIKHVAPHTYGFRLMVSGKTGQRRLLAISSAPYLTEWLNTHPCKADPNAFLWVTADRSRRRLHYARLRAILSDAAARAGILKKVHPHAFRHSRATHLANHLTEAQMKEYFGWVQASEMASVYVHLSGRDVDTALLRTHGIQPDEAEAQTSQMRQKTCRRCSFQNAPTNSLCGRCGTILDESVAKEALRRDLERSQADDIMDRLVQDDEFRAVLLRKLAGLGLRPPAKP